MRADHMRGALARATCCVLFLVLCWASTSTNAFGLGFMRDLNLGYKEGDSIPIVASSVTSRTRIVPLRWRDVFPCKSTDEDTIPPTRRNIGQILLGDTVVASGMKVNVLQPTTCTPLCRTSLVHTEAAKLERRIAGRYRAQLFLDGMPVIDKSPAFRTRLRSRVGVPLGNASVMPGQSTGMVIVYNHFHFIVHYYVSAIDSSVIQVVEFDVEPMSVQQLKPEDGAGCALPPAAEAKPVTADMLTSDVTFSYSVEWKAAETPYTTRWDAYTERNPRESKVHWYSILNVLSLVMLQSVLLWYLFVRAVRKDISSYNEEDLLGDREDSGWKLVYGDVFRPPRGAVILSVLVGNGFQLLSMTFASLLLAAIGMVSPGARGMLVTLLVMLFVFFASVNGVATAALIKFFKRRSWQTILLTAAALPSLLFVIYLALNFVHLGNHAASTLPFTTLLYLLALWLLVSVPLCFGGAVVGFSTTINVPVKVNSIPRTIPPQPWYMKGVVSYVALGIVPFAASYVELQSIFSSMWLGAGYHMFGFLIVAFALLIAIVAQISIFSTYYQLNLLNYHWWWRSFLVSASYGVWLMVYCIFYFLFISMVKGFWGMVLYFGYMSVVCVTVSLMFGAVGFLASFTFVRIVYASVKVD